MPNKLPTCGQRTKVRITPRTTRLRAGAHCMTRTFAVFLLLPFATAAVSSQTRTLWEIGKFDQSSSEFSAAALDKALYRVGTSDWSRDWPGTQKAGSKYEIDFPLDGA